jgi:hypothetical protein
MIPRTGFKRTQHSRFNKSLKELFPQTFKSIIRGRIDTRAIPP